MFIKDLNDLFETVEAWTSPITTVTQYKNAGLRLFNRPHNLYANVNKKTGEVQSYVISTVYTPFSKKDISVKTKNDGNGKQLIISIEKVNEKTEDDCSNSGDKSEKTTDLVCRYRGISAKSLRYEFPLQNNVDTKNITVKAEDGILTIILPVIKSVEDEIVIPIQ